MCSSRAERRGGGGTGGRSSCVWVDARLDFLFFNSIFSPCVSSCVSFPHADRRSTPQARLYIAQTTNLPCCKKNQKTKNGLAAWHKHRAVLCIWGEKSSFASHFLRISISARILPHSLTHQPHLPLPAPALSCLFIPLSRRPIIR